MKRSPKKFISTPFRFVCLGFTAALICIAFSPKSASSSVLTAAAPNREPNSISVSHRVNDGSLGSEFPPPFQAAAFPGLGAEAGRFEKAGSSDEMAQGTPARSLMEQGRSLYESGRYAEAAAALEAAVLSFEQQGNGLQQAVALSNLALVYQNLGRWTDAAEAIATSLALLEPLDNTAVLAQALDIQGQQQFAQGQIEQALATWERSASLYEQLGDEAALVQNGINQAEALQALGLYRRAIDLLTQLTEDLQAQPASSQQVTALRSLGDALRVAGELDRSRTALEQSLVLGQQLQDADEEAATHLSLGNTATALSEWEQAIGHYDQAILLTSSPLLRTQARLNLLRVLTDVQDWETVNLLIPTLDAELEQLPLSRTSIFARINFARTLIQIANQVSADEDQGIGATLSIRPSELLTRSAEVLAIARQQAQELGDIRAESFALGSLGELYEQTGQLNDAQPLAEDALTLAQQLNASDISYLWQWQLGRVHAQKGERDKAIAAYQNAIDTLQVLRKDLVAVNPDVQFSFRESIEPVHRELVSLLLDPTVEPNQDELEQARKTIESLQLAELDNFFREACLNAREIQIEDVDRQAAVIYPIILEDRLEVIVSLPDPLPDAAPESPVSQAKQAESADPQPDTEEVRQLLRHTTNLAGGAADIKSTATNLLRFLKTPAFTQRANDLSQTVYGWMIEPFEEELGDRQVKTLVFVLDDVLRNVPMAALFDGSQYLIEKYSVALAPSLQLLEAGPLPPQQLNVLLGGISESHQDFSPLPGVVTEFEKIQNTVSGSRELLNQSFTSTALQEAINAVPFPVVHLATHGEFSSNIDNTFILTWGDRLNINQLNQLLQATDISRRRPIELLVLSACTTAEGDDRAALGLAGVAVRAGARSTVATLWQFSDEAAPLLMQRFYQELTTGTVTKAEALRQAQLSLLNDPFFSSPYFWSPVVLVGNWL